MWGGSGVSTPDGARLDCPAEELKTRAIFSTYSGAKDIVEELAAFVI